MTDTTNTENADVANPNHAAPVVPAESVAPFPGVKIDPASLEALAQTVAAATQTPEGQTLEADVIAGIPKKARGFVYAGLGGLGTLVSSLLAFNVANPGVLPEWATVASTVLAAPLAAVVGSTAFANLGKK